MKVIDFPKNDRNFKVQYYRTREGPNWFLCYYKNAAKGVIEPLDAWRTLGVAKNMDTGKALKQWCLDTHEQYGTTDVVDEAEGELSDSEALARSGEFFDHHKEEEPNDNTKMIT